MSCRVSEKTNEQSLGYLKTERQTNKQTYKDSYYGPHRVNPESEYFQKYLPYSSLKRRYRTFSIIKGQIIANPLMHHPNRRSRKAEYLPTNKNNNID